MQPHEILGVAPDADLETIKVAYLERAKAAHPDAGGSEKEFVRLHAAFEAMIGGNYRTTSTESHAPSGHAGSQSWQDSRQQYHGRWWADPDQNEGADAASDPEYDQGEEYADVMREARERLDQELAELLQQGSRRRGTSMAGYWFAMVLTPVCAAGMATCFCFDGKPLERPLWAFSFTLAMTILVYTGSMVAVIGSSLNTPGGTLYRRTVLLITALALLIALPWSTIRDPEIPPSPLIARDHLPSWWPDG